MRAMPTPWRRCRSCSKRCASAARRRSTRPGAGPSGRAARSSCSTTTGSRGSTPRRASICATTSTWTATRPACSVRCGSRSCATTSTTSFRAAISRWNSRRPSTTARRTATPSARTSRRSPTSRKVSIGGNVSSTVFNQAYIGINYQKIGRVGHSLGADLYLGPLYTWGALGGRADFYLREPIYLDYAYNFSVRDFRRGAFGNVTRVDNTLYVKNSESFFTLGLGTPLTLRSVVALRGTAGHALLFLCPEGRGGAQHARQVPLPAARFGPALLGHLRDGPRQVCPGGGRPLPFAPHAPLVRRPLHVGQVFRHSARQLGFVWAGFRSDSTSMPC